MTHLDDDDLILYSFGATPGALHGQHLRGCSQCEAELDALTRLVSVGRTLDDGALVPAPDTVWAHVHAALNLAPELSAVPREAQRSQHTSPTGQRDVASPRRRAGGRLGKKWSGATSVLVAAAALVVGLVAGIVGTAVLSRPDDARLVAQAELEPFPDWQASGTARVEEDDSGRRRLTVDLAAVSDGLMEVWLLNPETSGLISLGLLSRETGTFSLPDNVDLSRYSVVDISDEPDDGNPAHSGDSIVRGPLRSS